MKQTMRWLTLGMALAGCHTADPTFTSASDSEIAVSVVGGSLAGASGKTVGAAGHTKSSLFHRFVQGLNPVQEAYAAVWSCSGGTLNPPFAGPGKDPYTWTPVSCTVKWLNGKSAGAEWNSTFTLVYSAACDVSQPWMEDQVAGCVLTRTTATGGNTRTLTGPDGNAYAITHDTNGAGSGWDGSVSPAADSGGVSLTCAMGGCTSGKTLRIAGSHLTGSVHLIDGKSATIWDHTLSTGTDGLTVSGSGASRVVSGKVTVQHNLAHYTVTATLQSVAFSDTNCCFPTSGTISTQFKSGASQGKTETLAFSAVCGEATLTDASGATSSITLQHCL